MNWRDLDWKGCRDAAEDEQIRLAEDELRIRFPLAYVECVKLCHGGYPRQMAFTFVDQLIGEMSSGVAQMLSFDWSDEENILATFNRLKDQLPSGVIPIADDGTGDFVCLDFRSHERPRITYWHHEREGEEALSVLAEDFDSFMEMLK